MTVDELQVVMTRRRADTAGRLAVVFHEAGCAANDDDGRAEEVRGTSVEEAAALDALADALERNAVGHKVHFEGSSLLAHRSRAAAVVADPDVGTKANHEVGQEALRGLRRAERCVGGPLVVLEVIEGQSGRKGPRMRGRIVRAGSFFEAGGRFSGGRPWHTPGTVETNQPPPSTAQGSTPGIAVLPAST